MLLYPNLELDIKKFNNKINKNNVNKINKINKNNIKKITRWVIFLFIS